MSRKCRNL